MEPSVIILSYNSAATIRATIESAMKVSDDVHVVDSFSSDDTCEIIEKSGARLVQHAFANYAAQRNWAIGNLRLRHDWELHLDADERLSDRLIAELFNLPANNEYSSFCGYHVPRLVRFLGRPIRHGGMFPIWHLRLFRHGKGRCEDREYDQHFIVDGPTGKLGGEIIDEIRLSLTEWTIRHNRWSDLEARELLRNGIGGGEIKGCALGSPIERKRYLRSAYYRFPPLSRAFLLFLYRYIVRLGFLDGKEGAIFFGLQCLWYRFLVDAKLFEETSLRTSTRSRETVRPVAN